MAAHMNVDRATARFGTRERARASLRRGLGRTLTLIAVAAIAVAVLPWVLRVAGYRPLIVQSGSMAPAVRTGDAIVSRVVHPSEVGVGDVVTFVDATRGGRLITHRVVEVRHHGSHYAFVTKGDGNTAVERWDIDDNTTLGRMALRIPKLGFFMAVTSTPIWGALLGAVVLGMLTVTVIRRIWS
jgi:signal peptidase I